MSVGGMHGHVASSGERRVGQRTRGVIVRYLDDRRARAVLRRKAADEAHQRDFRQGPREATAAHGVQVATEAWRGGRGPGCVAARSS